MNLLWSLVFETYVSTHQLYR